VYLLRRNNQGDVVRNHETGAKANLGVQELTLHRSTHVEQISAQLDALFTEFGEELFAQPDVDGGSINLVNEVRDALVAVHLKLPEEFAGVQSGYKGLEYHFDQPELNVQVFQRRELAIVSKSNLDQFSDITQTRFSRWKMRGLIVLPLVVQRKDGTADTLGTVALFSQRKIFGPSFAAPVNSIIERYSARLQTLWNQHLSIRRRKREAAATDNMQRFFACVIEMNSLTTVCEVYKLITREFIQHFHFDAVSILLADHEGLSVVETAFSQQFQHLAERHDAYAKRTKYSFNVSDGQSSFVFSQNQHFLVEDVTMIMHLTMSEKDRGFVESLGTIRTLLIVPIRLNSAVIGTLALTTLGEPRPVSAMDLKLIELLASFSSTAIRNAKAHELVEQKSSEIELLNKDLKEQMALLDQVARKDHLTGLNNFGSFEEELKRRTSEYARMGEGNSLSVILLDVDHFKLFNDANGHLAGNEILQGVAERILKCARDMDFVARYGGEEFVMLLPQCDLAGASMTAERIRSKIAEENFIVDGKSHRIAVSGGCAQFIPTESPHQFLFRADAALYRAKRNGRNRIDLDLGGAVDYACQG
jgi:diguanylate cyclase (GGDEF)-like protein